MAGAKNLNASAMSAEEPAADEESFYSGDEHQSHSGNEAGEDPAELSEIEDGNSKGLANGLSNCSITSEKRTLRPSSAEDLNESSSDEEMPEEASKGKQSIERGEDAAPGRPKFTEMILEAIVSAGPSRSGVSVQQIKKLVHLKYPDTANKSDVYIRNGLKNLVDSGKLIRVTGTGASGSFKLAKADKTKVDAMSEAPAASMKKAAKAGPKSATTAKSDGAKKVVSSKSPMKSKGKSTKAAVTKNSVATIKTSTVRLTKMSNGSKSNVAKSNAPPNSDAVAGTAKSRGRPAKQNGESAATKSPASKSKAAVQKSSVPSRGSTKVRAESAKSPAKPKSVAPKSPKPKSIAPKSPKPRSAAPKSPKPKSVFPKSPTTRTAASKTKLDSATDDAEKTKPGPASKRGKRL